MSVALSNGASVVAFIGLSGEALRGILFIYDIVEDIKDVPGHLRALYQDLTFFQLSLAAFQETTTNAARLGPLLGLSTTQVLDDAANAIKPILVVFQEYGLGRATPFRKRIRVALKKQKLLKYSERLVKSSSLIIATNANISMLNITFEQQNFSARSNVVSADFVKDITDKFAALERAVQSTTTYVLNTFMEISTKVNGLPDALGRRIESRFAELPVIAETARKTFLVVQSSFQDTPNHPDQLSMEVRRVVRDTVQRAIFEVADKQITVSDIEAIMRRVLLEHDLQISRNGSRTSEDTVIQSESLPQLEQSHSEIRRRGRTFQHSQDGGDADREQSLTGHDQDTEQDTKKDFRTWSLLVRISRRLDRRAVHLALKIALDTAFPVPTSLIRMLPHFPLVKLRTILVAFYKDLFARPAAPVNETDQVVLPHQQLYVNVVLQSGRRIKLFCLDVAHLQNDTEFFSSLKRVHEARQGGKYLWKKYLSLKGVVKIRFVEFEIQHGSGAVYVRKTHAIPPPEHSAYRYRYRPPQAELFPPLPSEFLLHLFQFPEHANHDLRCLDHIPKCTSRFDTLVDPMNFPVQTGWGLEIVEAWNFKEIIVFGFGLVISTAVLFGVWATFYSDDVQDSFLIGSWAVLFFILGTGIVQVGLHKF